MNNGAGTGVLPLPSEISLAGLGNALRPAISPLNNVNNFNWNETRRHYAVNNGSATEPVPVNNTPFEFLPEKPIAPISYDDLVIRFSKVLSLSAEDTRLIINNLNPRIKTTDFFTKMSEKLTKFSKKPWFMSKLRKKTNTLYVEKKKNSKTAVKNIVYKKPIGSGASGEIYISADNNRAYKVIRLEHRAKRGPMEAFFEANIREVFYEAFVQTILSSDPLYGRFILPVEGIFFEEAAEPNVRIIVIQMPTLYKTLLSAIEFVGKGNRTPIHYSYIRHVLKSTAETLIHFKQLYGFRHCDLHMKNIMYRDNELRQPYIIDFGRSCLTFNGVAYYNSRYQYRSRCESNDLLMLIVDMVDVNNEAYSKNINFLDTFTYQTLWNSLRCANPTYNFYEELRRWFGEDYPTIFHAVYPDKMNPGGQVYNHFNANGLLPLPNIDTPESFLRYLDNVDKASIELLETPTSRSEFGANTTDRRIRRFRTSTMAFRQPLERQEGTRRLLGGIRRLTSKRTRRRIL